MRSLRGWGIHRLGCVCVLFLLTAASAHAADSLNDLTGPWQLFIDDFIVEAKSVLTRKYNPFIKYGPPVLQADQPWEGTNVYLYGTVLPTEDHTGYRMWYHTLSTGQACYATSTNGINWTKPALGIITYNGSTANNMYTTIGSLVSVMHTPFNANPDRRYTFFAYGSGGYKGAWSPDAIHWTGVPTNPLITGGDVGHAMWDPFFNRYLGYVKVGGYVNGLPRRSVAFSETTDFTTWPAPTLIMTPDAIDDRWVPATTIQRTHFYGFCPFAYESQYIGFLWIYRATDLDGTYDGTIYVEVVSSRDGIHWTREEGDRPPILPLGQNGAWDDSMVFTSTHPLMEGDTLKLYYGGFDDTHVKQNNWHAKIGLATLRKDGFASLDAGPAEGTVTTKPLAGTSGPLHVNYRAAGGWLKVEVLDGNGQVIPGYGRDDCSPLQGDSVDQIVTWNGGEDLPASSGTIRLRFILKSASLYSFNAGPAVQISAPPSITQQPADRTIVLGGTASFSVQAIAQPPVTYRWQKNGVDLADGGHYSGTGTSKLTVTLADCQDVALYRCVVTHSAGSAVSAPVRLGLAYWTFTGIGMLPGANDSTVNGLTSDGTVAAGTSGGRAVIWSTAQGLKSLGLPPAAATSSAAGVGICQGNVVAAVDTNLTTNRAYRWDGNIAGTGSFTLLPPADSQFEWTVHGLGTDGGSRLWIAGSTLNGGAGNGRRACRYNQIGSNTDLMYPLPSGGHDHSDGHAVSDNGVCGGQYQYGGTAPSGGKPQPMSWLGGTVCTALNTLMGAPSSSYASIAKAISRNSLVIGGNSYYSGGGTLYQPAIWNNSTTPTAIPFIPGGDNDNNGMVLALNGDGTLAGGYSRQGSSGASEAFIWDSAHGTRSLQQVLTSDFELDLTGWNLQQVTAISADGLVLAGVGLHNGKTEGWVVYVGPIPVPPQVTRQPDSQDVAPFNAVTFTVQADGAAPLTYQWQKEGSDLVDGDRVTGATTPALTITGVRSEDAGQYRCAIQSACGAALSDEATLTILAVRFDLDGDGDVDAADLAILKGCLSGDGIPVQATPQCLKTDLDKDSDADLADFALFQLCLTGENNPSAPGCIN